MSIACKPEMQARAAMQRGLTKFKKRVNVSPNSGKLPAECVKAIADGIKKHHNPKRKIRKLTVEMVLHSYDTVFNMGEFYQRSYHIRNDLEKQGYPRPAIYSRHVPDGLYVDLSVSFLDDDPFCNDF